MNRRVGTLGMMLLLSGWSLTGCRTTLHHTTMDRVDQDLQQGNRGYLQGTPPAVGDRNLSRELYELEIELPAGRVKQTGARPAAEEEAAPARTLFPWQAPAAAPEAPPSVKTYRVRKGDSLWKIANRPEVYGDGNQWRAIYEANRDKIPDPNRLRAGVVLDIPASTGTRHRRSQRGGAYEK